MHQPLFMAFRENVLLSRACAPLRRDAATSDDLAPDDPLRCPKAPAAADARLAVPAIVVFGDKPQRDALPASTHGRASDLHLQPRPRRRGLK